MYYKRPEIDNNDAWKVQLRVDKPMAELIIKAD